MHPMRFRYFGRAYSRPDIDRRVDIGVCLMATHAAHKLALAAAVGLVAVATHGASAAGVPGINELDGNPRQQSLVGDELPQLVKRPTEHLGPLLSPELCPVADALEILHSDPASGVCSDTNDPLADAVVGVAPESGLAVANALHRASRVLPGAPLLVSAHLLAKRAACACVGLAHSLDGFSAHSLAVAGRGQVDDAEINADEVSHGDWRTIGHGHADQQEPFAVTPTIEIALPLVERKPLALVTAHYDGNDDATAQRQERNAVGALEAHHAAVEGHGRVLAEPWPLATVTLIGFDHIGYAAHRHLRGEPKPLTDLVVMKFLQRDLVGEADLVCLAGQPVGSFIEPLDRLAQPVVSLRIGQDLCLEGQFHNMKYMHYSSLKQLARACSPPSGSEHKQGRNSDD